MAKLRAGKKAKASILTRMIKPKQPVQAKDHRSDIILEEQFVNEKGQKCVKFRYAFNDENGPIMSALKHWIRVVQEGDVEDLFDETNTNEAGGNAIGFIEPAVKWKDSQARRILYNDIVRQIVPRHARYAHNRSTMPLVDIY